MGNTVNGDHNATKDETPGEENINSSKPSEGAETDDKAKRKLSELIGREKPVGRRRDVREAEKYRDDFRAELGFKSWPQPETDDLRSAVNRYIVYVLMGADYYNHRIARAMRKRIAYLLCSIVLIIAIPIALSALAVAPAVLSNRWPNLASLGSGNTIVAEIVGGLTAIAGLQRALFAWTGANQRYAIWRSTLSTLRGIWYGLHTKWHGRNMNNGDWELLKADLVQGTDQARAAIAAEQDDFYKNLSIPNVDILSTLGDAQRAAFGLVTSMIPSTAPLQTDSASLATKAANSAKAKQDIVSNQALMDGYDKILADRQTELSTATDTAKGAIEEQIKTLRQKRADAELAKVAAQAALTAAQTTT
jgi:hypothetical protein